MVSAPGQSRSPLWPSCLPKSHLHFYLQQCWSRLFFRVQIFPTALINVNCFSCFELRPHWLESPIIDQRGCSFATQFNVMESYSSIYRWKSPAFNHFDCYLTPPLSTRLLQPMATTPRQVQMSGSFLSVCLWPALSEQFLTKCKNAIFQCFVFFFLFRSLATETKLIKFKNPHRKCRASNRMLRGWSKTWDVSIACHAGPRTWLLCKSTGWKHSEGSSAFLLLVKCHRSFGWKQRVGCKE